VRRFKWLFLPLCNSHSIIRKPVMTSTNSETFVELDSPYRL
jgi:hypothetical protein